MDFQGHYSAVRPIAKDKRPRIFDCCVIQPGGHPVIVIEQFPALIAIVVGASAD